MRTVRVGNEDLFAAFVCDFALRGVNERGKRDAKKIATMNCFMHSERSFRRKEDRNNELFHAFGALTLGKRAFLIRSFRFFPSVDIR